MRSGLLAFAIAAVLANAASPHPAVKNLTCGSCHVDEAQHQPQTPMGRALQLPPSQTSLESHPLLVWEKDGYSYRIERANGRSTYTVTDGKQTVTVPIQYAFGVGMQTYVLQYGGRLYESLVSYYPSLSGLSTTMGDEALTPHTVLEAMGRQLPESDVASCFGCHSTAVAGTSQPSPASFVPGVRCEHCHPGGQAHLDAMARGQSGVVPKRLGMLGAEDISTFCGACHRSFDTVVSIRAFGPVNVRFQPYRLAKSPCFNGADARISCVACHNPHRDLVTDSASYDTKCLACHAAADSHSSRACPVAKANCVSCHMPKVELPGSHTTFTDHMIRVVKPGEPYPE